MIDTEKLETDEQLWLRYANPEKLIKCVNCDEIVGEILDGYYSFDVELSCKACAMIAHFETLQSEGNS